MLGINKITLLGHVGKDPEVRYMPDGRGVANVSLATSERWKDRQTGEKKEATEWHNLVFYEPLAEVVNDYVRKGAPLYVEGKVRTRKWQDKEGRDRYTTEVIVSELRLLGDSPDRQQAAAQPAPAPARPPARQAAPPADDYPFNDDVPF